MHLPISSDDTLHFYWYLKTHMLVADGQFLLLIVTVLAQQLAQLSTHSFHMHRISLSTDPCITCAGTNHC